MGKINWRRVFAGGLLAMFVMGVFPAFLIPRSGGAWQAAFENLGDWATPAFLVSLTGIHLAMGIAAVWLYAAIRPRYGPGPKTAAIAGFAMWLILGLANLSFLLLTDLTTRQVAIIHGPSIVQFVVSTMAGAWLYQEASSEAGVPHQQPESGGA
jgi:hypothetical protein